MYRPSKASMLGLYGSAWLTYDLRYLTYPTLPTSFLHQPPCGPRRNRVYYILAEVSRRGGAAFLQVDETGKANAVFVNVESGRGISQLDGDGDGDGCGEPAKAESPS